MPDRGCARSTLYRHRLPPRPGPPRRRGPVGPRPDAALLEAIRATLAASPFHGEGHRKIWAPAFVQAPEGSGCAERFIRTLKENLLWVRTFDIVEELRHALLTFRDTYSTTWLIQRHGFQTPAAIRQQHLQPTALGHVPTRGVAASAAGFCQGSRQRGRRWSAMAAAGRVSAGRWVGG